MVRQPGLTNKFPWDKKYPVLEHSFGEVPCVPVLSLKGIKMYSKIDDLPTPIHQDLDTLDVLADSGDINEQPHNVFIGHNLGHRVFTMSVPFRKFFEISAVANDRDAGPVAQRPLDPTHAKKLAVYMVKGLVSAAKLRRIAKGKEVPIEFDYLLRILGEQPYFSIQPLVCNLRNVPPGANGPGGVRGFRLETRQGETAAFRIFLSERHVLWVIDGQHRRYAAELALQFLDNVRRTRQYPGKGSLISMDRTKLMSDGEMLVWNEAWEAARAYATLTLEVHLGLTVDQEKQLFHDLNRLVKKVDPSLALQFDSSNPITQFIKRRLAGDLGMHLSDTEAKDWSDDTGALMLKDVVAINAVAFLNKGNISGATPAVIEPRELVVFDLWSRIGEIPDFGSDRAKEKTVAAQPVVLKALAKIAYDFNFSNRRVANSEERWNSFLDKIAEIDFSHSNPMWRYYEMSESQREEHGLGGLATYLPEDTGYANRDLGLHQNGLMRFGAKHNDIFPLLADMIRWATGLPTRRE
jgi:hypothetical protein